MCQSRLHCVIGEVHDKTVRVLDADGIERVVSLLAFDGPPPAPGSWLVVHSGYALEAVEGSEAEEALAELSLARARLAADQVGADAEEEP